MATKQVGVLSRDVPEYCLKKGDRVDIVRAGDDAPKGSYRGYSVRLPKSTKLVWLANFEIREIMHVGA